MNLFTIPWASGREHCHTGTTCLFTWFYCMLHFFFFFPQAKSDHQGSPFWRRVGHQEAELSSIQEESFQQCIEVWQRIMEKSIKLEGGYFEEETMFRIEINCLWHQLVTFQMELVFLAPPDFSKWNSCLKIVNVLCVFIFPLLKILKKFSEKISFLFIIEQTFLITCSIYPKRGQIFFFCLFCLLLRNWKIKTTA